MINEEVARKTLNMEVRAGKVTGKILLNLLKKLMKEADKLGGLEKLVNTYGNEAFKVANFSVVSKGDEGNKVYRNCSAYGEKSDIPKDFKQGDFVKLFGQIRTSIDDNGKEHSNIRLKIKENQKKKRSSKRN